MTLISTVAGVTIIETSDKMQCEYVDSGYRRCLSKADRFYHTPDTHFYHCYDCAVHAFGRDLIDAAVAEYRQFIAER